MGHLYHGYVSHNQRVFGFFIQGNLQKLDMTECFFCLSSNHAAVHPEYINQLSLISCHIFPLNIIRNGSVQQPYIFIHIPLNPYTHQPAWGWECCTTDNIKTLCGWKSEACFLTNGRCAVVMMFGRIS